MVTEPVNISQFVTAGALGLPLLFFVMVLVEFAKDAGLKNDSALRLTAWGIGLAVGSLYQVATVGLPGTLAGWLTVGAYGLFLGVCASKLYQTSGKIVKKALESWLRDILSAAEISLDAEAINPSPQPAPKTD